MIVAGKVGLNIACTSFCNSFKVTVSSDVNVFTENEELCQLMEKHIMAEIKRHDVTLETKKDK